MSDLLWRGQVHFKFLSLVTEEEALSKLLLLFQIEIATVMPSGNRELLTPPPQPEDAGEEEEESTPRLIDGSSPQEPEFTGVLGPHTNEGQVHPG